MRSVETELEDTSTGGGDYVFMRQLEKELLRYCKVKNNIYHDSFRF